MQICSIFTPQNYTNYPHSLNTLCKTLQICRQKWFEQKIMKKNIYIYSLNELNIYHVSINA